MTFIDSLLLWLVLLGPIAAWVFLFWLTHRSDSAAKYKKQRAEVDRLHKSLEKIGAALEKNPRK